MRWDRNHSSPDLIDKRGQGGGGGGGLGMMLPFLPLLLRSKFGWAILLLLMVGGVFGRGMCGGIGGGGEASAPGNGDTEMVAEGKGGGPKAKDERVRFMGYVLDDAQNTWTKKFAEKGAKYERAQMVLFTDQTSTGCGYGKAATGPFYCPSDQRVYLDLSFFRDLDQKLGAEGDFAQAYVVAHEIGHHVQRQTGVSDKVQAMKNPKGADGPLVRLELQADCYAGIWANGTKDRDKLEHGDLEEALDAASAIGDDRLQKQSGGVVSPESFSHGTSAQRAKWFRAGFESGRMESCDTFTANDL